MGQPTRGAIAAGHPQTVAAGEEMLRLGGNAFDAVAAAMAASFVTEPGLTSAAGGGFLLAHTPNAPNGPQNTLFDFFTQTPRHKNQTDVDFYPIDVNFGSVTQQFHIGLGSMAVPGCLAGLCHVHKKFGRLPLKVVLQPAIQFARDGIEVNEFQAYCFDILSPILLRSNEFKTVLMANGQRVQVGDRVVMSTFAHTLSDIAVKGSDYFYTGDIGRQLVQDCQEKGGHITLADLEHYQVVERSPLTLNYRGKTLLTNPPPSSGGTLIAFALELLRSVDFGPFTFGSRSHIQCLAKVMQLTNVARKDGFDDRLYRLDIAQQFLAKEHYEAYEKQLLDFLLAQTPPDMDRSGLDNGMGTLNKWGSTTHISVIDAEGNAASVTASNGEGSGYTIPGTGIMVNNMLGEADLHPNGFHQWPKNVRISSMMAPTIMLNEHQQPEIVLGSGGSNRIRTAILQVLSNLVDFNMPIDPAVNRPRVHWENGTFGFEPGLEIEASNELQSEMATRRFPFDGTVEPWDAPNMFFGGVHAVVKMADDQGMDCFDGAGDRRRGGTVSIVRSQH